VNPPKWNELETAYRAVCRVLAEPPGAVHMLGIGGVGMAALAVLLKARGHRVSGCDAQRSRVTVRLEALGIPVALGHDPAHLTGQEQFIVRSPAVRDTEPEWRAAAASGAPVFSRGVVLPALAREYICVAVAGCHGKTTTTAMLAHILRASGRPTSFAVGGEVDETGAVAEAQPGGVLALEADESDGTLALYEPTHAVVTNVELDHVDFFRDTDALDACFRRFVLRARGDVWFGADDPGARRAAEGVSRARGFGFAADCHLRGYDVREEGLGIRCALEWMGKAIGTLALPVPGRTNLLDAMAAMGAAQSVGVDWAESIDALRGFRPVRRRFEIVLRNARATVVSDYAHHPTEIRALLAQARALGAGRRVAVFQPHRYSRTAALGAAFAPAFEGVDRLILAPVYAASEDPAPGGSHLDLAEHFRRHGRPVETAQSLLEAWGAIRDNWRDGDVLLVIGAGDVETIAAWAAEAFG
jgi:UDP-N-acetylmuramate--alanine ligase